MGTHMTDDILEATRHTLGLLMENEGDPVPHGPEDPKHLAYVEDLVRRQGYTPERYPALFDRLHRGSTGGDAPADVPTDAPTTYSDGQVVDYVAPLNSGLATGHALLTRTKPISSAFIGINVVNVNNGTQTVVASGSRMTQLQQTIEVVTDDSTAQPLPSTGQNYGTISWSIEYADGTTEGNSAGTQWAYQSSQDPTVLAPVISPTRRTGDLNNIMIGLARGFNPTANNTDIDYWFWQSSFDNNTLLVPLQGSMYFQKPIAPLSSANPQLKFYLARKEGGMRDLSVAQTAPYMPCFSIDTQDPKKLNFTLLATQTGAGNAINFGVSPWVSDTQTFFTAMVFVTLNDRTLAWSSIVSSLIPDLNPVDGVKFIPPIKYVWHCLAAGTQVTMADGTTTAIENMDAGMTVKSNPGTRTVQATLAQPHWGPVYTVATAGGLSVTCSGTHPFMTVSGYVPAAALMAGDQVVVATGMDTVSSITQQQQSGEGLFNVWLAGDADSGNAWAFYANGFEVGDYQVQVALLPDNRSPDQIRAALPEHLQRDYESHLEDHPPVAASS
jgi:hypothetical protein